jgi:hypothetical protein
VLALTRPFGIGVWCAGAAWPFGVDSIRWYVGMGSLAVSRLTNG